MNLYFCTGLLSLSLLGVQAQIVVTGIAPRTEYTDRAAFTILHVPGYTYSAALNGVPVSVGELITVTNADFYELSVQRTADDSGPVEHLLVPFIVISSVRGSSEAGLSPWTPLPTIPSASAEFAGAHMEILAPQNYPAGMALPLIVWIRDENGRRGANGFVGLENQAGLQIHRGVGSTLLTNSASATSRNYALSLPGLSTNFAVNLQTNTIWTTNSGAISVNTIWPADSRMFVQNLSIQPGITLLIQEGCVIKVAPGAEIIVSGILRARGTLRNPVVFAPANQTEPWGGIELRAATAELDFSGTILTGGGADDDWFDSGGNGNSHRDEQPILFASNGARITLADSALIYGAGQAGHSENGFLNFTRTLIQGFITAGQYNGGSVTFVDSAAVEFPRDDDHFADFDNDGFYLTGGAHYLTNSLIGWVKDDGIDSGSGSAGSVTVVDCWIESCFHEGLAWSEDRTAIVTGTVVLNCGQGIETGFGTPEVVVSNSLSTANLIGVRFGDNYDWDYDGFLRVTNSLMLYNSRDVWGITWDDWAYRSNQMDIAGNRLTQPNAHHPTNNTWNPSLDGTALREFIEGPNHTVGAGLGLRSAHLASNRANVPVRLSSFTTNWVRIEYAVRSRNGAEVQSNYFGTLTFAPGQTVQSIPISQMDFKNDDILQVQLLNATNAELTGVSRAYRVPQQSPHVLIPLGAIWKYPDPSTNFGSAWTNLGFDDSGWRSGPAELGDGDGDEATVINIGQPNRFPTVYFRHQFVPQLTRPMGPLVARLKVDDGALVNLNGQEIFRANMPAGTISYSTFASRSLENNWFSNTIPASVLSTGTNVIAVEVHQRDLASSDLSFDFELRQEQPLKLRLIQFGNDLVLTSPDADTLLQKASTVSGPWTDVAGGGQTVEIAPTETKEFYRLRKR